jgi:hypothetical protein
MTTPSDLANLKGRVSDALLGKVRGVTGVGLPEQGITIYLEADTPDIRAAVKQAIEPLQLPVHVHLQVTGKFQR